LALFVGSFGAGYLPLMLKCSDNSFRLVTTLGVGLLIGVAFIVIIPEGFHAVYACEHTEHLDVLPPLSDEHLTSEQNHVEHEHEREHGLASQCIRCAQLPGALRLLDYYSSYYHCDYY
jgi:hypothetical protein